MITQRSILVVCLLVISAQRMQAQQGISLPAQAPLPPVQERSLSGNAVPSNQALPPYEPQLDRLAELIGALAYLRDLCGKGDGAEWRGRMTALLDAEATTPSRRERLAGAYNSGFKGYETNYRVCTPSAELIMLRFLDEGGHLAHDLATRFGGG